jgi:ABC-type sugar transport system, permease component
MMMKQQRIKEGMVETISITSRVVNIILAALIALIAFCAVVPMWHVLMASLSDGKRVLAHEGILWLPVGDAHLEGYRLVLQNKGIISGYMNTLIYVVGACSFGLILNTLGGYAMSQPSKLKGVLVMFVMFTSLFSGGLIPTYAVIRSLGMTGTRWALLIPGCTNSFFMIMLMNGFRQVPVSTVEAARIDGAGHLRVMFQVMLPQARSMMVVTLINSVVMQWNSWFNASIYVTNQTDLWPLQLWIKQIVAENITILQVANPDYNRWLIQFAIIVVATFPLLLAFPFFQKKLEMGMLLGGVKE